jgi:CRP/FNR family transcriptional regulator
VSGVYLIDSGTVQLYRLSPHGQEQILAMPKAGDPLAEWAIFQGTSYPASALCISPCRLVFIERTVFESLIRSDGVLAMKLLAAISLKLQRALGLIEDLSLRDARARLCRYLNTHLGNNPHPGQELALPVTQVVLARFLGIRGETLSRSLRQLRADGILEHGGRRRLVILDPIRLSQAAEGVRD